MPLFPGQVLNNRYRIVKLIGKGGFGAVYKAWDVNLNHPIAVKENFDTSPAAKSQFLAEASILANLRHPNLPVVSDHFSLTGQGQYLVIDYVEGEDLEEIRQKAGGCLPESQVLPWIIQVLDALDYLHNENPPVIHRDIKPANIIITPKGRAMLVDFGIAKKLDRILGTSPAAKAATPGYSPIEQYSKKSTDARSDIYALGATLYTLLTGKEPPESFERVAGTPLIEPGQCNPSITSRTETAIMRAMEIEPGQRYQNAVEFKDALLPRAKPPSISGIKMPWRMVLGGLVVLLVLGIVIISNQMVKGYRSNRIPTQTAPALVNQITRTHTLIPIAPPIALPSQTPLPPSSTPIPFTATSSPTLQPPTSTPVPNLVPTLISIKDGMVMVHIPAGDFMMGAVEGDNQANSDEIPRHKVYIDAFWMYSSEVTNAMYDLCVKAKQCKAQQYIDSSSRSNYYDDAQFADYPVIYVSWYDAKTYCEWADGRLPSEAEWEKAARGGLDGKVYPWGNEAPVCDNQAKNGANYSSCSQHDTTPVGYFQPNGYGLYDMAGNVWEWVADLYGEEYYSSVSVEGWLPNPTGVTTGTYRVLRGGSWNIAARGVRGSDRSGLNPIYRGNDLGFRCAR